MVFALVVQLTGIMLYGYCLGVIAATLTNAASFRSVFSYALNEVDPPIIRCPILCVCVCNKKPLVHVFLIAIKISECVLGH